MGWENTIQMQVIWDKYLLNQIKTMFASSDSTFISISEVCVWRDYIMLYFFFFMDAFKSSEYLLSKILGYGISTLLDNVPFMRYQAVLIVPDFLFFNGPIKILSLLKLSMTVIH